MKPSTAGTLIDARTADYDDCPGSTRDFRGRGTMASPGSEPESKPGTAGTAGGFYTTRGPARRGPTQLRRPPFRTSPWATYCYESYSGLAVVVALGRGLDAPITACRARRRVGQRILSAAILFFRSAAKSAYFGSFATSGWTPEKSGEGGRGATVGEASPHLPSLTAMRIPNGAPRTTALPPTARCAAGPGR